MPWRSWIHAGCLIACAIVFGASAARTAAAEVPAWAKVGTRQKMAAEKLGVPVAFENKLGMRFVLIPGGTFTMGMSKDETARSGWLPQRNQPHKVRLTRAYYLQTTEMTVGQVRALLSPKEQKSLEKLLVPSDHHPVVGLGREWALELLTRLAKRDEARTYRLPTEAEWERAARGGKSGPWYWGKDAAKAREYEVLAPAEDAKTSLAAVASRKPNPFGLYDMLGNASERTADLMGPLSTSTVEDPRGPVAFHEDLAPLFGRYVMRGGNHTSVAGPWLAWLRWGLRTGYVGTKTGLRAVSPLPAGGTAPAAEISGLYTRPLVMRTVRVEDGFALPAPWGRLLSKDVFGEPKELEKAQEGRLPLHVAAHGRVHEEVVVTPPKDRAVWNGLRTSTYRVSGRVPHRTKRIEVDAPLYQVVQLMANLEVPQDTEAQFCSAWLRGLGEVMLVSDYPSHFRRQCGSAGKDGRVTVGDVPWIPGAPILLESKHGMGRLGGVEAALPWTWTPTHLIRQTVKVGFRRQVRRDPNWLDEMLGRMRKPPASLPPGIRPPPKPVKKALLHERPATSGRARLVCLSADGAPLPGAIVLRDLTRDEHGFVIQAADMAIADTKGIVRFPSVPAGTHAFDVFVESRPAGRANITIVDGKQAKGEVHCGRPGHVEILVRRAEGGVAAWARVEVLLDTKREWDNLDGEDVLRLAPRTDHAGRATLHNLPHGQHIVRATWLGRRIEAPVVVDTGSRARLDLELPAPKGWPPIGSR